MNVVNAIGPVMLLIVLGFVLFKTGKLSGDMVRKLNWMNFWLALPALLIIKISAEPPNFSSAGRAGLLVGAGALVSLVLALPFVWGMRLRGPQLGAFLNASFRGNLAFLALPVVIWSTSGSDAQAVGQLGALVLGVVVPFYNLFSVTVLLIGRDEFGWKAIPLVLWRTLTNPLLFACAIGLALAWLEWPLGPLLGRTLQAMADLALPAALLCIGAVIAEMGIRGRLKAAIAASAVKSALTPLIGYLVARSQNLNDHEMLVTVLFLAAPSAVAGYVMAQQMGADESLAASSVMLSTIVSLFSMATAVHFLA